MSRLSNKIEHYERKLQIKCSAGIKFTWRSYIHHLSKHSFIAKNDFNFLFWQEKIILLCKKSFEPFFAKLFFLVLKAKVRRHRSWD